MKRILFHYSVFNRGGAEKSTLRLMRLFVENGWNVDLVLNFRGGTMEREIPDNIKIHYLSCFDMKQYQKKHLAYLFRLIDIVRVLFMSFCLRIRKYEIACIGLQGLKPMFVCNIVRAKKRFLFIRSDISSCVNKEKIIRNIKKYEAKIDNIICVSETAKKSVDTEVPEVQTKTKVVYNVICSEEMKAKLDCVENPFKQTKYQKVVTVCRMQDKAKGLFRMLEAYDILYKKGLIFEWYFVGDGVDLPKMKQIVNGKPYESMIHFEGEKSNPFPYYKYADLVAVLSYYEGLCGVVNEAKVSGAAVIATEFSGIHEQIIHGEGGWIVENNLEAIVKGLEDVLGDPELLENLKNKKLSDMILNDERKYRKIINL